MDKFVLTSYLSKRHSIANRTFSNDKKWNDPRFLYDDDDTMMGDQPVNQRTTQPQETERKQQPSPVMAGVGNVWRIDDEPGDDGDLEEGSGVEDTVMYEVEWSIWSPCSATCGGGTRTRHSRCADTNVKKLELCLQSGDERVESQACNTHHCASKAHHLGQKNMVLSLLGNHHFEEASVNINDITNCPCLNGGSCVDFEPKSVWPFLKVELRRKCHCAEGYTGKVCESPVCTESCANGGICIRPDVCYCSKMYSGATCETPICNPPCENDGECVKPGVCSCKSGFGHARCTPICPGGCGQHGVCTGPGKCTCHTSYHGFLCGEKALCAQVCANGGVCEKENVCRCQAGWTGVDCSTPTCEPPCENGGVCIAPGHCSCPSGTLGPNCNISKCSTAADCTTKTCSVNSTQCEKIICIPPCQNGGTCASNNVCVCTQVTTGHRCERKKCDSRPVQEPFTRGFRRVAKSHNKCRFNNLRLCVKQFPHYETVYKTYYQTQFRCIEE